MELRRQSIYRIHKKINGILSQDLPSLLGFKIFLDHNEIELWIYILETLRQHIAFRSSDSRIQGQKLSVLVCHRDIIAVKNDKVSDSCPYNHFCGIATYATYTYHGHRRVPETLQHLLPDQHRRSFLPIVHHSPLAFPSSQIASISARVISFRLRP